MQYSIRPGTLDDVTAMVSLSYQKRRDYEKAQPQFWKYAEHAEETQSKWFKELLKQDDCLVLVTEENHEVVGFIIGHIIKAPEVYNPGGLTLMIDDFCVKTPQLWNTVGKQLISEIKRLAKDKNASQILTVCGAHDGPKQKLLKNLGLTVASQWYVGNL